METNFSDLKDLLHPDPQKEREKHKLKRLVQHPNSYFMVGQSFHIGFAQNAGTLGREVSGMLQDHHGVQSRSIGRGESFS